MKCEEFEQIGLDAERDASLGEVVRTAAHEHASTCSRCAALQDSWNAARIYLREFAEDTAMAQAPARVEMRLRQELRTRYVTLRVRRTALITAWALATAAVLISAVSWRNWRRNAPGQSTNHENSSANATNRSVNSANANPAAPAPSAAGQQPDGADSET